MAAINGSVMYPESVMRFLSLSKDSTVQLQMVARLDACCYSVDFSIFV
jgi:hypothetical protein